MERELCRYCRHPLATVDDVHNENDEPGLCWSIVDRCDTDAEEAIDAHLATIARLERELEQERQLANRLATELSWLAWLAGHERSNSAELALQAWKESRNEAGDPP